MINLRSIFHVARIGAVLVCAVVASSASAPVWAAIPTPTPVVVLPPTAAATSAPIVPTATARPTAVARVTVAPIPTVRPRPRVSPTHVPVRRQHARAQPTALPTPTVRKPAATPVATRHSSKARRRRRHHSSRASRPKPSPTPSPTPILNLNAEDSIAPVTCNGPGKPVARHPFLSPPYRGWTSIVSYFDHDSPNYLHDGLLTIATGVSAQPDAAHVRTDFPAYWNSGMRQYLFYDGHNGYDYNLWYQPVYAAAAGKVIFAAFEYPQGTHHGYGRMAMIEHKDGYVSLYGHFSKLLVKVGQKVRRGQQIGVSGNTGFSTGPHLHFTVFHNCTPVDPYGWTGPGPDPLANYQQESSTYLWRQSPLVDNPAPNWPGMSSLAPPPTTRIILLRLPTTRAGAPTFTSDLRAEAARDATILRSDGASVRVDLLRGALIVRGPVTADRLYALPAIASISSPGTIVGAKTDVLAALAQASQTSRRRSALVDRRHHVTGYLFRWQGRTLLVGTGKKGSQVAVRLSRGEGGAGLHVTNTNPSTGAYAIDLGPLSSSAYRRLARQLSSHGKKTVTQVPQRVVSAAPAASASGSNDARNAILATLIMLMLGVMAVFGLRRGARV